MIWDELKYFKKTEFDCKCGCGKNDMDEGFLKKLDNMRHVLGFPLVVTSGYRCPDYNERVSTTGRNGPHTTGKAVDLSVFGYRAWVVLRYALGANAYPGVGLKQHGAHSSRFIHLDDLEQADNRYRPTTWTYARQ